MSAIAPHKVPKEHHPVRLGEFPSTAIAGNDILSSCLYVTGIATLFAGIWAPLVFLLVALVLWLYKHVYTEVVEALPLNGGAYNCLLNATSKTIAATAGVMTVLSYVATSVISAKTAAEYLHTVWPSVPVLPFTALIIIGFMLLTMAGVRDSAKVAMGIFVFHLFTLILFVTLGLLHVINTGSGHLVANWQLTQDFFQQEGALRMIFLAFAASLLGVSGFESSANFVEEQKPGVFRYTLRNMLWGVLLFNPLITLVLLHVLPLAEIWQAKDFVLSQGGLVLGGFGLQYLIVADAFLVLSGAVLASFVGATGLLYRMTLDHCFPTSILLPRLRLRNANMSRIVIAFSILCLSILFVTGGNLLSLAGVYTMSFLAVMTTFALGNIILRETRPELKRTYQGPIIFVFSAGLATTIGIVGNVLIDPNNLVYFLIYFLPAFFLVQSMIYRDYILEALLKYTARWRWLRQRLEPLLAHVTRPRILLFTHHPRKLYRSLEYIRRNETSRRITIIFCTESTENTSELLADFERFIQTFHDAKVFANFELDFVVEQNLPFGPEAVRFYAQRYRVHRNAIFIGSIHDEHDFSFEDLGGVRIIQ